MHVHIKSSADDRLGSNNSRTSLTVFFSLSFLLLFFFSSSFAMFWIWKRALWPCWIFSSYILRLSRYTLDMVSQYVGDHAATVSHHHIHCLSCSLTRTCVRRCGVWGTQRNNIGAENASEPKQVISIEIYKYAYGMGIEVMGFDSMPFFATVIYWHGIISSLYSTSTLPGPRFDFSSLLFYFSFCCFLSFLILYARVRFDSIFAWLNVLWWNAWVPWFVWMLKSQSQESAQRDGFHHYGCHGAHWFSAAIDSSNVHVR